MILRMGLTPPISLLVEEHFLDMPNLLNFIEVIIQ